jgi:hypothetical protein
MARMVRFQFEQHAQATLDVRHSAEPADDRLQI